MNALNAPFSYPGGKGRDAVTKPVWAALGQDVSTYIEPFCGSLGMLLARPGGAGKYEVVGDANGLLVNLWRSIRQYPWRTSEHCDQPPSELELQAKAAHLLEHRENLSERLKVDPHFCDPELAGYWLYCQSVSFSPDWLTQKNPPMHKPHRKGILSPSVEPMVKLRALSERLRRVGIAHGDWSRLVTPSALGFHNTGTTPTAIFFDPPYPDEPLDYGSDPDTARDVETWCRENGDDQRLRICLAGHVDDYDLPGWRTLNWGGSAGYGRARRGNNECLWFSPHCIAQRDLFGGVA